MLVSLWLLAGMMAVQPGPQNTPNPASAADRVVLRDGSTVLGVITSMNSGARGSVELLVHRDWADHHIKAWADRWDRGLTARSRTATRQRRERLLQWNRERSVKAPPNDRILDWIQQEQKRLERPGNAERSLLMPVSLSRSEIRSLARQTRTNHRLLQLGWICRLPGVETMSVEDLKQAVEGRGFAADGEEAPTLAGMLPLEPESDLTWLARRAATELAIDPGLRFVRYQNLVLPDAPGGQGLAPGGLDLSSALGEITKLLDPNAGKEDPLVVVFTKAGESGHVGVVVTRLEVPADFSQATVDSTLWIRAGTERWVPFRSRSASVRPDATSPDAGQNLAGDPQVQTALSMVEMLGLGQVSPEIKQRGLRMGAATEKALGLARGAIAQDLNELMLPIFDWPDQARGQNPGPADGKPAVRNTAGPEPTSRPAEPRPPSRP